MPEPRIEFDGVWKKFRRGELHDSLRDLVPAAARRLFRRGPADDELGRSEFWAVSDVSFLVRPGEALGIIGPNGAGKSTVLKLLTRIMKPTRGWCGIEGRVGSLIEIAAGFHPDLTGRENLFLQGAIRGMGRREVARKFDDIVELAGLAEFIDTPVKRYSSGMNARLGFSIAVHLDPDVLVVDEVLSVGDYAFQRKAFERIKQMMERRIPIVIVSHQLERVAALCSKAILLDRGRIVERGAPAACIAAYVAGAAAPVDGSCPLSLERMTLSPRGAVRSGGWVTVTVEGSVLPQMPGHWTIGLLVRSLEAGRTVFATNLRSTSIGLELPPAGAFCLEVELQANAGRGLFAIESKVWDPVERRDIATGPQVILQIDENQGFHGSVNMHARARLSVQQAVQIGD